jgi:hypothetical protein
MANVAKKKQAPRIKGICDAALALGVTRQHLALVIRKKRASRSLLKRYRAWRLQPRSP